MSSSTTTSATSTPDPPHLCHHPRCEVHVPPRMLACRKHWYQLPRWLRDEVWDRYSPGQERRKDPSSEYLETVHKCIEVWETHGP